MNENEKENLPLVEARLNLDMVLESHERQMMDMRQHYGRIILGLVLTLILLVGSALGGIIYVLCNYDINVFTYEQTLDARENGKSIIEDGIHVS